MSDKPGSLPTSKDHLTRPRPRDHHMMRDVVRNMVANMEFVLNDLHGIMGDIQSLVVQIDSVTNKIDEQCGGCNMASSQGDGHVIRKPEALDGETYWSTRRNSNTKSTKITDKDKQQTTNPIAVGSKNAAPPFSPAPQNVLPLAYACSSPNLEQSKRLSNVERWLQQEKGFYKHSSLKQPIRRSKDPKTKDSSKRNSSNFEELKLRETRNPSHLMMQPSLHHPRTCSKVTFLDEVPLSPETDLKPMDFHACVQPAVRKFEGNDKDTDSCSDNTYLEPVPYCPRQKDQSGKKQIRVFNSHYEENTTADESSLERNPSSFRLVKHASIPCTYELNNPSLMPSAKVDTPGSEESQSTSLPNSPFIQRRRGVSSMLSSRHLYSPGAMRRPQSRLSNTNTYQSLESDLDSNYDQTDPRCLTPDMDWSYLSLVGGDANRQDRSPGHVYQTIESPVFQRRRFERHRGRNSFAFQTSPDIVSRLMTLEEVRSRSSDSQVSSSENYKDATSLDSSVVNNLEEIVGSLVITHVFCNEVSSTEGDEYCGYYEALVDAVLENLAGFETLEEACAHLDNNSGVVEDTYINFDDGFEEDEWGMSLKQENDDYFEDDIDFNLLNIPGSQKSDDFSMKSADAINSSTDCDATSVEIDSSLLHAETTVGESLHNVACLIDDDSNANLSFIPEGTLQYDDLDFSGCARKSFVEEDSIAMCTLREDEDGNFSLWSKPFPSENPDDNGAANDDFLDGIMTPSDEASCQAIGSRSGSSNMSFGSADMAFTSPEGDGLMTSSEADDLYISQDERSRASRADDSPEMRRSVSKTEMSVLRQEFFRSLYSACDKRDNETNISQQDDDQEDHYVTDVKGEDRVATSVTDSTHSVDDADTGLCPDDFPPYNRRLNTWTAYAMVHVSADDVSDSASDIINDNSITCSMTSSYFEADNNAAGSANQGFVDI